ncbi:hypothetical protein Mt3935_03650, partial [Mycobacterium tuberculosis]
GDQEYQLDDQEGPKSPAVTGGYGIGTARFHGSDGIEVSPPPALRRAGGRPAATRAVPRRADRVRSIDAKYVGDWQLPVLATVSTLTAVLIRTDGCVAEPTISWAC